ncbi:hypothetical protein EDD11_003174 [Mortierella claussenii]|nr:hypothetical protein EDD11_003174 [Mortierella claussenii]
MLSSSLSFSLINYNRSPQLRPVHSQNFKIYYKAVPSVEQAETVGSRIQRSIDRPELRNHDRFFMLDRTRGHYRTRRIAFRDACQASDARPRTSEPQYQELVDGRITRATPWAGVVVKAIAGGSYGAQSKVYTRTPTMYFDYKTKNKTVVQSILPTFTGFINMLAQDTTYIGDKELRGEATTWGCALCAHHRTALSASTTGARPSSKWFFYPV